MAWRRSAHVVLLLGVLSLASAPFSIQTHENGGDSGRELRRLAQLPRLAEPATEAGTAAVQTAQPLRLRAQRHRDSAAHSQHLRAAHSWQRRHLAGAQAR